MKNSLDQNSLNRHELIKENELLNTISTITEKKSMKETEAKHGNSYYYGNPEDKSISLKKLLQNVNNAEIDNLYVHIPFCKTICDYCTYPKIASATEEQVIDYISKLNLEISKHKESFKFSDLKTIHIGGGTPNFLNLKQLDKVLEIVTSGFPTQNLEELAIEVSPVGLDENKLKLISNYKFNRISIGIQTFDDSINEQNGRKNQKAEEAIRFVEIAKKYFPNISIDLLAGQKGQTKESFSKDFEKALELDVNSIFLYQVRQVFKNGGVEEIQALNNFLNYFSFDGYEILSHNHVIKKRNSDGYCEQREGRGKMENLLGIGPGAVSEIGKYVFKNICPVKYLNEETTVDEKSIKSRTDRNLKALFIVRSLRYFIRPDTNGMLVKDYQNKFKSNPFTDFKAELDFMKKEDLINAAPEKIEVTSKGILFTQWMDNYLTKHYK